MSFEPIAIVGQDCVLPVAAPQQAVAERVSGRPTEAASMPPPGPPTASAVALTALVEQRRRVTDLHHRFLREQHELHTRFLAGRAHAESVLLRAHGCPDRSRPPGPTGPTLDRHDVDLLAAGRIDEVFGPGFADCAGFRRWTALPAAPWNLVDRVLGIDAEPGVLGTGTVWTETDLPLDAWFIDDTGRLPAGLLVEAGQASLLLASWMGVDRLNRGERVYRLLGCELTFHGSPPEPGQTLGYEIRVTGHTRHDAVRMLSYEADCRTGHDPRLSLRAGRAGFFTDKELAAARGVRWDPDLVRLQPVARTDPPPVRCAVNRFSTTQVGALAAGRPADCFGPAWKITGAHVRTPRIGAGRLRLLGEVGLFDPEGGPWRRGYLSASTSIGADDWFFTGHFPNDPCMPGNLMLEGCLQAMAFYLAATGVTLDRDGWRFEPVPDRPYQVSYRAQVTPRSRSLTYEVFVHQLSTADQPELVADVLCSVDGVRALHVGGLAVRLVPDWPLNHWRRLGPPTVQQTGEPVALSSLGGLAGVAEDTTAAEMLGVRSDFAAMLTNAWGRQADLIPAWLADRFADQITDRHAGRLPGPPYLFITRIRDVSGPPGEAHAGTWLEAEYDVPERVWYFDQNGCSVLPLAALMEILMQPCGALSTYVGSTAHTTGDLFYRNLDGTGVVTAQVGPGTRSLRTRVELRSSSRVGESVIDTFDISCHADGEPVFAGSAAFGFFPGWAFNYQPGLPPSDAERARLAEPSDFAVDLRSRPARYCGGPLRLAGPMLLMLDRVTGFWPDGGPAGLGRLRAETDVDANAWYFKAHFFQDPVQPGSLGNEAICQLMQFFLIETAAAAGLAHPVFEPVMLDAPVTWKYRGQVVPTDDLVTVEVDILAVGDRSVRAEAWLWVDGRRIYHLKEIGMRVVTGKPAAGSAAEVDHVLDPAVDTWLDDHSFMWTVPTLPMMSTVDLLAAAAADYRGAEVTALRDLRLHRWLPVPEEVRLRTRVEPAEADLRISLLAWSPAQARFVSVASALTGPDPSGERPEPFAPLTDLTAQSLPYESAEMFHGPDFQYLTAWWLGATGASGVIDAGRGRVPRGYLGPGVLDAMTHVIPHHRLDRWSDRIKPGWGAFPSQLSFLRMFEPLPETGELRVEARFAGFERDSPFFPAFDLQLCRDGRVVVALRLVEAMVPLGRLSPASPLDQRAFLRDHEFVDGIGWSTTSNGSTVVFAEDIDCFDLLPGFVAATYRLPAEAAGADRRARIAIADHVANAERVHPSRIDISDDLRTAHVIGQPDRLYHLQVTHEPGRTTVSPAP